MYEFSYIFLILGFALVFIKYFMTGGEKISHPSNDGAKQFVKINGKFYEVVKIKSFSYTSSIKLLIRRGNIQFWTEYYSPQAIASNLVSEEDVLDEILEIR